MILFWSFDGGGGPLQFIGLALILLQLFLPLLQNIKLELTTAVTLPSYETLLRTVVFIVGAVIPFSLFICHRAGITSWQQVTTVNRRYWVAVLAITGVLCVSSNPVMLIQLLQFLPLVAFFYNNLRGQGPTGGGGGGGPRPTQPPANDLSNIVKIVSRMPIEEYVAEHDLDQCTISELKKMLKIRQSSNSNSNSNPSNPSEHRPTPNTPLPTLLQPPRLEFLEKHELVEAVRSCRQASDSCCICYEDYQKKDLLRVLPQCRHEFHLECIDQWAYTFATSRDRQARQPSCPLCNAPLR